MIVDDRVLPGGERTVLRLKELYRRAGFLPYKMSKFEEYDLYGRNKDFLISENVLTFTDTNGKLMALKPDVTLSIIKNSPDPAAGVTRVFYDENVYRPSAGTHTFRELRQVGLEAFGSVTELCVLETILLAAQSLETIAPDGGVLLVSHLGILEDAILALDLPREAQVMLWKAIGEKNTQEIERICKNENVNIQAYNRLCRIASLRGSLADVLASPDLPQEGEKALSLRRILRSLAQSPLAAHVFVDFSADGDIRYYNGIFFKGYVRGIPNAVLSGGQYDRLMKTMHRASRAIGFAVYCDRLERLFEDARTPDADVLLLADEGADGARVMARAEALREEGKTVSVQTARPTDGVFGTVERFSEDE